MEIRNMTESDLEQVCKIEQETFSEPWSYDDFNDAIKNENNRYLVAERSGEIAGYCGYFGVAGEGYIYNVAVKKEYRRQHIGVAMLKELIQQGMNHDIERFTLEVRISNTSAVSLYQSLGFESAGIRKDFYNKPREDAVIMWLNMIQ